ncbi:hypothetical protein DFH05DRAFT_1526249 [Lentinula detonsa]|uniref:DUF6534 domain-containing protein n=1 Tax=Lentinula detonsa TaxID=2804962 RepID=A0A9W8NXS6_9AGAR|nr:hypothetical protein DFH05DRAFT_1526249 [Lentinula detonsa]
MSTAGDGPIPDTVQQTSSALFFGFLIAAVLYGIVLLEGFRYFKSFRNDSIVTKALVALLCGLDTLHFGLSVHVAHHYLVRKFEDPNATVQIIWSVKALGTTQVVLIWLVQCLYLVRIWNSWLSSSSHREILLHQKIAFLVLFSVVSIGMMGLGSGLVLIIGFDRIQSFLDFNKIKWAVYLSFGIAATIDIAITTIMSILLYRGITGTRATDGVLSTLICYFFSAGLSTSLAEYAVADKSLLYMGVTFLISRIYTISFLELLNVRKQLREDLDATTSFQLQGLSSMRFKTREMSSTQDDGFSSGSQPSSSIASAAKSILEDIV